MKNLIALLLVLGVLSAPGCGMLGGKKEAKKEEAAKEEKPAEEAKKEAPKEEKKPEPKKEKKKPAPEVVTITEDPEKGAKRLARLWNEMETSDLKKIFDEWKDQDLVPVLAKMDNGKVAEVFGSIEEKRAAELSRLLMKEASKVPVPTEES
jgi:hypothetical protein